LNMTLERKNKELEEKNEEITSFAFIASHDLKEPLRKLYTFSDWLLNRELENLSDTGKS
jgi:light-regulated signal transduction histidine kinase (bacteriophytochrome)